MKTLLTGGAGYIGSHTAIELLGQGHEVVIFDNFSNSHPEAIRRVEQITGRTIAVINGDVRDQAALEQALREHDIDSVVHFAGKRPWANPPHTRSTTTTTTSTEPWSCCARCTIWQYTSLSSGSSATVYGTPQYLPYDEKHPTAAMNPYGRTKLMAEEILADLAHSDSKWSMAVLRYFNPIGAHPSGLIGEDPADIPNNLLPYIAQVAVGRRDKLQILAATTTHRTALECATICMSWILPADMSRPWKSLSPAS